jgi:paraquat-inducible protein A
VSARKITLLLLALLYVGAAVLSAWNIVVHTRASTDAIEKILNTYNLKNEAAQTLASYTEQHPILGGLFSSPIEHVLKLPSQEKSDEALSSDIKHYLKTVREESSKAAWWSWFLLSISLFYVVAVISLERRHDTRPVLFASTTVSVIFFFIGIIAPAMVIWTAPNIPLQTGNLNFVAQHQVRGIAAIIWELFTGGHWMIGGFLFLFSIVTPLTKASLTYVVTVSSSKDFNYKIGQLLHSIGKWSMADVFVAAILLALYALKFQEATKSVPCLGLYYFIGYCLLGMTTNQLLVYSGAVAGNEKRAKGKIELGVIGGLLAGVFCFIAASSLYTYQQYTENTKESLKASMTPGKLNNADLVLPVHK